MNTPTTVVTDEDSNDHLFLPVSEILFVQAVQTMQVSGRDWLSCPERDGGEDERVV